MIAAERAMLAGDHEETVRLMAGIRELGLRVFSDDGGDPIDKFLLWFDDDTARLRC